MSNGDFLLSIVGILLAVIGYFLKQILTKVEKLSDTLDALWDNLHDMRPKVDLLWEGRCNRVHKV